VVLSLELRASHLLAGTLPYSISPGSLIWIICSWPQLGLDAWVSLLHLLREETWFSVGLRRAVALSSGQGRVLLHWVLLLNWALCQGFFFRLPCTPPFGDTPCCWVSGISQAVVSFPQSCFSRCGFVKSSWFLVCWFYLLFVFCP
jgi:hypothetical protein